MPEPVPVFIISRNRALYLWAGLDSLFKYTKHPHYFILGDNGSDEPLVQQVIEGFSRRGMFARMLLRERNDPDLLETLLAECADLLGRYFAFVESDVMVLPQKPCWLTQFVRLMDENSDLAMLGSFVDQDDFIGGTEARTLEPHLPSAQLDFLIKANSPERKLRKTGESIITPDAVCPNPPGRLIIYRTAIVDQLFGYKVRHLTDVSWHEAFTKAGYKTGIAAAVRHRHLSLLNLYDYPSYDQTARDWFFHVKTQEHRTEAPKPI
jgi:hypothetical protein